MRLVGSAGRNRDVLAELYEVERPGLVRLALLITGSPQMAEDAFHEAVARVGPRLGEINRPGAYLRTVVLNTARAMLRRSSREVPTGDDDRKLVVDVSSIDTRQVEIWSALRRVSERRRTALVLRYYGDLSTDEIAEILECRPGTVSSLLHRGVADLRRELGDG